LGIRDKMAQFIGITRDWIGIAFLNIWVWVRPVISSPYRFFKTLCYSTGFFINSIIGFFIITMFYLNTTLPEIEQYDFAGIKKHSHAIVMGKYEKKGIKHKWLSIRNINRDLLYSIVFSEDKDFFNHTGINYYSTLSALAKNIKHSSYKYGGSTISQQVAKNIFLSNEKSMFRKLKEILLSWRLEKMFSKNQILEIYLNIAEFGPDIFGVRHASYYYFRKTATDINAAEGAFMALMLPSPRRNHYSLFKNKNLTFTRKIKINRILRIMLNEELISEDQFESYKTYNFFENLRKDKRKLSSE